MWIIANNTNNKVLIDDLKLELGPKEKFDLSNLNFDEVKKSSNLARLMDKGILKTLEKNISENQINSKIDNQSIDEMVKKISQRLYEAFISNIDSADLNIHNSNISNIKNVNIKDDKFKDISIEEVQNKIIKEKDKLSASFGYIGQKQEVDESKDIEESVSKLKDLKKGNKKK